MSNVLWRLEDAARLRTGQIVLPHFVDFHTSNFCEMDCLGCAYHGKLGAEVIQTQRGLGWRLAVGGGK